MQLAYFLCNAAQTLICLSVNTTWCFTDVKSDISLRHKMCHCASMLTFLSMFTSVCLRHNVRWLGVHMNTLVRFF